MKYKSPGFLKTGLVLTLAVAMTAMPVAATNSSTQNLSEVLQYQQREWSERELRSRGYSLQDSDWHGGSLWQYWWNGGSHTCVQVQIRNNEVTSTSGVASTDCGQYHEEATNKHDDAAKVVAAAAIIGGLAAVAHKSHHRDEEHGEDAQSVAEFERGYRDGLHREDYHNYNNTKAYSDGYSSGVEERHEQTSYSSRSSSHSGYRSYVSINDLVGARASGADAELRNRGFTDVGGYKSGRSSHVFWWNAQTRQCVDVVTRDGRISSTEALQEPSCRTTRSASSGTPSRAEQACLRDVTAKTDNPDVVLLESSFSEAGTEVILGVGPGRARWRCIGYRDGTTAGIRSLTDEGAL